MLKLASWNVNSVTIRLEQMLSWFETSQVDVLALQETKITDDRFPSSCFIDKGFHVVFSGQKTYNGTAIISRLPMTDVITDIPNFIDPQRRIIAVTVAGFRLLNLYVPNGSAVGADKYYYKLDWLAKVETYIAEQIRQYPKMAIVGDFNIAPDNRDVHDPSEWEGCVLVSPAERQAFTNLLGLGFVDSFRMFEQEEKQFSWWDYRAAAFRRNRGLRIDHILLSLELAKQCKYAAIDKEPRKAERPSDHTPVYVEFEW